MRVGIIGAMVEEIEPLLQRFEVVSKDEYANNTYYVCKYKELDIVVAYSKIGKVFSTITTSVMILKYGCEKILFTGVAGSLSPELKIGDLMHAEELCQHDLDITAFGHPHGFVPEGARFTKSCKNLNTIAKNAAKKLDIKLHKGKIATGDQFVADVDRKEWIKNEFDATAVEMEGGAVAMACSSFGVPFFILRAISDSADDSADMDFDEFLKSSAKVSADFLCEMLEDLRE
ncbi:MAG: 5'-methylthioadenosine/adenosylhomocysteine nucleosidase [Campylobacterales bacterium]